MAAPPMSFLSFWRFTLDVSWQPKWKCKCKTLDFIHQDLRKCSLSTFQRWLAWFLISNSQPATTTHLCKPVLVIFWLTVHPSPQLLYPHLATRLFAILDREAVIYMLMLTLAQDVAVTHIYSTVKQTASEPAQSTHHMFCSHPYPGNPVRLPWREPPPSPITPANTNILSILLARWRHAVLEELQQKSDGPQSYTQLHQSTRRTQLHERRTLGWIKILYCVALLQYYIERQ